MGFDAAQTGPDQVNAISELRTIQTMVNFEQPARTRVVSQHEPSDTA